MPLIERTEAESIFKAGDIVYVRARVVGFEDWKKTSLPMCADIPGCIVQPVDKRGEPLSPINYYVDSGWLIHPQKVMADMKARDPQEPTQ